VPREDVRAVLGDELATSGWEFNLDIKREIFLEVSAGVEPVERTLLYAGFVDLPKNAPRSGGRFGVRVTIPTRIESILKRMRRVTGQYGSMLLEGARQRDSLRRNGRQVLVVVTSYLCGSASVDVVDRDVEKVLDLVGVQVLDAATRYSISSTRSLQPAARRPLRQLSSQLVIFATSMPCNDTN
jgi:hypothetical protein